MLEEQVNSNAKSVASDIVSRANKSLLDFELTLSGGTNPLRKKLSAFLGNAHTGWKEGLFQVLSDDDDLDRGMTQDKLLNILKDKGVFVKDKNPRYMFAKNPYKIDSQKLSDVLQDRNNFTDLLPQHSSKNEIIEEVSQPKKVDINLTAEDVSGLSKIMPFERIFSLKEHPENIFSKIEQKNGEVKASLSLEKENITDKSKELVRGLSEAKGTKGFINALFGFSGYSFELGQAFRDEFEGVFSLSSDAEKNMILNCSKLFSEELQKQISGNPQAALEVVNQFFKITLDAIIEKQKEETKLEGRVRQFPKENIRKAQDVIKEVKNLSLSNEAENNLDTKSSRSNLPVQETKKTEQKRDSFQPVNMSVNVATPEKPSGKVLPPLTKVQKTKKELEENSQAVKKTESAQHIEKELKTISKDKSKFNDTKNRLELENELSKFHIPPPPEASNVEIENAKKELEKFSRDSRGAN